MFPRWTIALVLVAATVGCGRPDHTPPPDFGRASQLRSATSGTTNGGTAAQAQGSGWGTLTGVFRFEGQIPAPEQLAVNKDLGTCKVPQYSESLVIDPQSRGVRDVVVFLRSRPPRTKLPETLPEQVFDQRECIFLSHVKPVLTNHPVIVKNSDPVAHNTKGDPTGDTSFNFLLSANSETTHTFRRAQSSPVPISCSIHAWMSAYIFPRDNLYVAVTDKDGRFSIPDLPAGVELEFQVWHERGAGSGQSLDTQHTPGGRFKATIPENGAYELPEIVLTPQNFR